LAGQAVTSIIILIIPHTSSKYPTGLLCDSTLTAVRVTTAKVLYYEVLHPEGFTKALPSDLVADTMICLT